MDEKDYFAVYDKKMLWRANLYIKETSNDWNDLYPWNAPPAHEVAVSGGNPAWGKKADGTWDGDAWGYNEWNRRMKRTPEFVSGKSVGLANLPAGDGKQVVEFPAFTPLRTLPSGQAPSASNSFGGTVAYSYPQHDHEPSDANPGYSGSQDSPFDFLWKMLSQKTSLSTAYDANGVAKTQQSTTSWSGTKAPKDSWKNYSPGTNAAPGYIPSLGLWYRDCDNGMDNDESGVSGLAWSQPYIYEAGTDCLGFAQRAGSWMKNPTTYNDYIWHNLLPGEMEYGSDKSGTSTPGSIYTDARAGKREYPGDDFEHEKNSDFRSVAWTIIKKERSATATPEMLDALRHIVPGDIWVKESSIVPDNGIKRAHIAIIAKVPDDPYSITDPLTFMNGMILIEAEYTNKVQSVIKKLSLGDYNRGDIQVGTEIYEKFTVLDQKPDTVDILDPISLNCKSWAVRRLK